STYALPRIMSCILSYHVPPLCKGRPRAQEVVLATSGAGGCKGGVESSTTSPCASLQRRGQPQHFFVFRPPCGVHDAQKHEFIRSCVLDMLQAPRRHVHNLLRPNRGYFTVHVHSALSADEVIDFRSLQPVRQRCRAPRQLRVRQAVSNGGAIADRMEQLAEERVVPGQNFFAVRERPCEHGPSRSQELTR